jgi:drug/metabolite transporter (DMT)-like permease
MTDATAPETAPRPLLAAGWMVGAIVSFAAMAVGGRELSAELDTFEIMAFRSAIGLPVVIGFLLWTEGWRGALTAQPGQHAIRNVIHFAAQNLWFFGIATIPLAQLVSLEFTNPIWVALLAPLLLGETLTARKLLAAALGFAGVLVIARPGVAPIEAGHVAGLLAAVGFALTNIFTKRIMRRDSAWCVLFWMTASQMVMGFLCAAPGGVTLPSPTLAPWMLFVGLCGLTAHLSLTQALRAAPASIVAPMEFARLPVVAAAGLWLYGEPLELALLAGAALILLGNTVNLTKGRAAKRGV